jgi:DNA modification methylase
MHVNEVYEGDCLDVMRQFPDNCIDTILTDPPYGLEFMGKGWDHGLPGEIYWREALRVAKPGATLMAFGGTRTHHRLTCAIEDAGWEIRDCIMWIYGSGFPKSLDIGKAIDRSAIVDCRYCNGSGKGRPSYMVFCPEHGEITGDNHLCPVCDGEAEEIELEREPCKYCGGSGKVKGAEREVVGFGDVQRASQSQPYGQGAIQDVSIDTRTITAPATPLAQQWDGWGTALKPAFEPIVCAMKPVEKNFAHNAAKWGVSGIWVDGGRVGTEQTRTTIKDLSQAHGNQFGKNGISYPKIGEKINPPGRWPANVIHDGSEEVEAEFAKAGVSASKEGDYNWEKSGTNGDVKLLANYIKSGYHFGDTGTPSRFFYTAKASPSERRPYNNHPTVKPLSLLRYLAKLTKTPTGGIVLDPFAGSGTTALACIPEGRDFILIEKEPEYAEICRRRIAEYTGQEIAVKEIEITENERTKQLSLW